MNEKNGSCQAWFNQARNPEETSPIAPVLVSDIRRTTPPIPSTHLWVYGKAGCSAEVVEDLSGRDKEAVRLELTVPYVVSKGLVPAAGVFPG